MPNRVLYGGVEAGGTKFVCGIGSGNGELLDRLEIETNGPSETLDSVINFFKKYPDIKSVGIGSFGPIEINRHSKDFGTILQTPKPGWEGVPLYKTLTNTLNIPVQLVTDTDVAAIGEYYHGIGLNIDNFIYITIGTGIGGSIMVNGKLVHGFSHPEMGHIKVVGAPPANMRVNPCPYHADCLESLASGKAIELRYGQKAELLTNDAAWEQEALYLAQAIVNIFFITQPERVILGGSVMKKADVLERIAELIPGIVNGYVKLPPIHSFLTRASSDSIGVLGAIKLASLTTKY